MRNSNVIAIAPTATIANIMGTSPCIEPMYKNLFAKSNLSGEFVVLNPFLVRDLKAAGLWSRELAARLKYLDGDLTEIAEVPAEIRERYRTAFQLDARGADRRRRAPTEVDRPVAVAEPVPRRARHEGDEPHVSPRLARRAQDDVLPAHARGVVDREGDRTACSIEAARRGEDCEACQ